MNLVIVANDINLAIAVPAALLKVIQQFVERMDSFLRCGFLLKNCSTRKKLSVPISLAPI